MPCGKSAAADVIIVGPRRDRGLLIVRSLRSNDAKLDTTMCRDIDAIRPGIR